MEAEEKEHIFLVVFVWFCLAVLPGNYVGYQPDEVSSVFDEVSLQV